MTTRLSDVIGDTDEEQVIVKKAAGRFIRASNMIGLVLVVVALIVLPHNMKKYGVYILSLWALYAIAAQGLNLTLGYAGQVSLAQAAFLGIGAYCSALLTKNGVSFWLALPLAGTLCTVIGALIGFPALRVQHHYLAFVTLGFNALVVLFLRNEEWLTGGTYGILNIERPSILGFSLFPSIRFYYFCLVMLAVVTVAIWFILRSPWGRAFRALRDNPARAASLGISIPLYTLLAFAIGSGISGIAGAIYAPLVEFIDPVPFGLSTSLALLLMVVVGGQGTLIGAFIGALFVTLLPEWLRWTERYYLMLYAIFVMILMVFFPAGIAGMIQCGQKWLLRRAGRSSNVS
jgi:branched-chain amino acid transport system permease protein